MHAVVCEWGAMAWFRGCCVGLMVLGLLLEAVSEGEGPPPPACAACRTLLPSSAEAAPALGATGAVCRDCFRRMDHRWPAISTYRYAWFADGTLVDFKHFRASMLTSQVSGIAFHAGGCGIAAANLAGWAVEWVQLGQGHTGGRPLGGNEDLYSNFVGSLFGQAAGVGAARGRWAERAVAVLERLHGPLQFVSSVK